MFFCVGILDNSSRQFLFRISISCRNLSDIPYGSQHNSRKYYKLQGNRIKAAQNVIRESYNHLK